ncbi:ATP-dependent Clp protease proteolytic subunit [Pseudomonas wadenswilerensis]|jgi:ATP-dependent protease ClpP protease subunit|uniref:Peptidase n=1 Tax=Pseudomonas wadenswilerensis TaxID=1785161 RepID=A0A380SZI4_9PSED|nr:MULTISPECIES: ATP-dependent Clp protease proteolytic subunit [Pseudomonas]MCE5985129.1 ATP-dependent Clp protease proteolytic subunit [Pseudomonas sp. LF19]UVM19776.1 ATP-dependent Clp protease proteolytic subunit [Pseudomonas wadenswilerensis]SPO66868.1 Protease subunit of ATP-dependent protease [Pseudomonas sp. JV241A]SUQ63399.1 Peptidase [Pseudomonas wadenswilerensis]
MSQQVIHFHCQIDQDTTERFRDRCLQAVDDGATSLLLFLSTTGGSTNFGFSLYSFLKSLPVPLCAVNAGNIESMGIIMYLAAAERVAAPHSRFLIHPMTWHFSQSAVDHSRLREYLSSLNNDLERYVRIFELETAQAERKLDIFHCLSTEEKVIPAYDSLPYGIAHRLEQVVFEKDARHLTVSGAH